MLNVVTGGVDPEGSDSLKSVPFLSQNADPMVYPILYPSGEPGWSVGIPHVEENATEFRNQVTVLQFHVFF